MNRVPGPIQSASKLGLGTGMHVGTGLPHAKSKQLFGPALEIIGLYVDPRTMMISMSEELRDKLITAIRAFINTAESRKRPLVKWQCILSWINWGLNVFPLQHHASQLSYVKIMGKHIAHDSIYLNRTVIHHFNWLADTIEASDSVHMLDAIKWNEQDANLVIYCDALLVVLDLWPHSSSSVFMH